MKLRVIWFGDRDRIYGTVVMRRLRAMGIRDKPTAPASPWQNGFAERLIGSTRRECLDQIIFLGEAHLRRILKSYADYFNDVRTHRSPNKDVAYGPSDSVDRRHNFTCPPWRTSLPILRSLRFSVHTGSGLVHARRARIALEEQCLAGDSRNHRQLERL
jgi:hypothetical protein